MLLEAAEFQWLHTHPYRLVNHLSAVRWITGAARRISGERRPKPSRALPGELPPSRLFKRLENHIGQMIRYDMGRVLPKQGRCTLVVAAQRPAEH